MAVAATSSASSIKFDYMNLLVTQMKNQNPLEPMNNDQMTAQLAQLSSLEQLEGINNKLGQLETMNSNFSKVLNDSQLNYARSLVGKQVSYVDKVTGNIKMEVVDQIEVTSTGFNLRAGKDLITLDQITAVGSESAVRIPNDLKYANSLVNRTVYWVDTSTDPATVKTGKVNDVTQNNDKIYVRVDNTVVPLDSVAAIME
ncbi:MAG: hypothetical protein A2Y07_09315 [Planctomycetes bacterium GWF2_50_10]|nr:MAG: hypothetical protein A2Y07_09315 [Planctomycetes bacterium GWF2_50_10]